MTSATLPHPSTPHPLHVVCLRSFKSPSWMMVVIAAATRRNLWSLVPHLESTSCLELLKLCVCVFEVGTAPLVVNFMTDNDWQRHLFSLRYSKWLYSSIQCTITLFNTDLSFCHTIIMFAETLAQKIPFHFKPAHYRYRINHNWSAKCLHITWKHWQNVQYYYWMLISGQAQKQLP